MTSPDYPFEILKIFSSGVLGGVITYAVTNRVASRKKIISGDLVSGKSMGGFPNSLGLKLLLGDQQYDLLKFSGLQLKNMGAETVEEIEIVVWNDRQDQQDWFVKGIQSNAAYLPETSLDAAREPYVSLKMDALLPQQTVEMIIISRYDSELRMASKTKSARFVDIQRRRANALKLGGKVLRFISPISFR
jgi:hypothetical protein